MDDGPNQEGPRGRSNVGFLSGIVDPRRSGYGVEVRAQEEQVDNNVDDLSHERSVLQRNEWLAQSTYFKENAIFPSVSHGGLVERMVQVELCLFVPALNASVNDLRMTKSETCKSVT